MNTLTVLHSLPTWLPLTATWLHSQVRFLPADIISHVACDTTENLDQFPIANLHVRKKRSRAPFALRRLLQPSRRRFLLRSARRVRASVLHSHWGDVAWRDLEIARTAGARHVATFYGKEVNFLPNAKPEWRTRYRELFQRIDVVLCEGPHMGRCIEELGCPPGKVEVHHLGVRIESIPFRPRVWDGGPLRILMASSFREKKGIPDGLRAAGILRREVPQLEITIIGDASRDPRSQPEKAKILGALAEFGLEACTRLLGYQPHAVLCEEAYRHHIFMAPSLTAGDGDTEGGAPVTLIEMAASGMPIVSTTHCDIPSVVIHGRTGLLAKERDVGGLLQHLRWYVAHREGWSAIVGAGRRHVEAEYDAAKQGVRLGAIYRRLAAASARA